VAAYTRHAAALSWVHEDFSRHMLGLVEPPLLVCNFLCVRESLCLFSSYPLYLKTTLLSATCRCSW